MKLLALLLVAGVVAAYDPVIRYDGYRVLEVGPLKNEEEVQLILNMVDNDTRLRKVILYNDNLSKTSPASLAVAPDSYDRVIEILNENDIFFTVVDHNLQESFDATIRESEEKLAKLAQPFRDDPTQFDHDAYLRYADQVAWLNSKAAASPIASTWNVGASYAGRQIVGIRINTNTNLPAIYLDSNIHAREWITSASMLYIIDQILTGTSTDAVYLRNNFRWYIIPNLNPDGYEYCWTNDRMWRKTRKPNSGSTCVGTDPNRNWDSNWGGSGASTNPCAEDYRGSSVWSEPETQVARNFLQTIASISNVFISVHSYSNLWLIPWGGRTAKPTDYNELLRVANAAVSAIQATNGLRFTPGTPPDLLYVASGGSFDWAKEKNSMVYAYSPECRPATAAQGGFNIPASNILPSGREIFAAVVAVARNARH
jgi:carboxypeptidase A2